MSATAAITFADSIRQTASIARWILLCSAAAALTVGGGCYFCGTKSMIGRTSQVPSQPGQFLMCSSMNSFALASASS